MKPASHKTTIDVIYSVIPGGKDRERLRPTIQSSVVSYFSLDPMRGDRQAGTPADKGQRRIAVRVGNTQHVVRLNATEVLSL